MFPFQRSCELSFQVSNDLENSISNANNIFYHPQQAEQNVSASISTHHHINNIVSMTTSPNTRKGRPRNDNNNNNNNNNDDGDEFSGNGGGAAKKRIIHREIERQRRQQMAKLYSSLRTLLPMEYIKGKRSISDHITEATRYIKDMEKNVKELGDKRDKLKASTSSSSSSSVDNNPWRSDIDVSIHKYSGAIEVQICVGIEEKDAHHLSTVLRVLTEEGLNVVNCVSSQLNQRMIYVIHCEVSDATSIDSQQLQTTLSSEIGGYDP